MVNEAFEQIGIIPMIHSIIDFINENRDEDDHDDEDDEYVGERVKVMIAEITSFVMESFND